jgi:hypothetical protein
MGIYFVHVKCNPQFCSAVNNAFALVCLKTLEETASGAVTVQKPAGVISVKKPVLSMSKESKASEVRHEEHVDGC